MIKEIKTTRDIHIILGYFAGTIRGILDGYPCDEVLKKKLLDLYEEVNQIKVKF